jgi:hypothetical protein
MPGISRHDKDVGKYPNVALVTVIFTTAIEYRPDRRDRPPVQRVYEHERRYWSTMVPELDPA